ncbi:hypothetical protein SAMN05660420_02900 [Desulfuromusa kysingii]|uniref:Uncharacterized protein n=1 Tax=Desulfuromusa kysingii TaxID=37625 RepID=A0A1H4DEF3_9BACT|nr:hypothetical protein [Desulfuromusa kysingii]SEA70799.1 hypothetical protein SAMN05660420_02900 [Desulfuromusa kysingii]
MSIPIITLDFCSEPVDLHCPVCGQLIFSLGVQQNICPHLLFWGDSAAQSYAWQQDQDAQQFKLVLKKRYEEACKNGFYGTIEDYTASVRIEKCATIAAEIVATKTAFMFAISTSDIGCGGMHNGTIYALFAYQQKSCQLR